MRCHQSSFICWSSLLVIGMSIGCVEKTEVVSVANGSSSVGSDESPNSDNEKVPAESPKVDRKKESAKATSKKAGTQVEKKKVQATPSYPAVPPTIAGITDCFNLSHLKPKTPVDYVFYSSGSVSYSTQEELGSVSRQLQEQLATHDLQMIDSNDIYMNSLTFTKDDRPATIMISNSVNAKESIVEMNFWGEVDLSALKPLPGAFGLCRTQSELRYTVPTEVEDATQALAERLSRLEWPLARKSSTRGTISQWIKDGLRFTSNTSRMENQEFESGLKGQTGSTHVYISSGPHFDLTTLPTPKMVERLSRSAVSNQMDNYIAVGKPQEVTKAFAKVMGSQGWTSVRVIRPGIGESQSLLIRNGCFVEIQASAMDDGNSQVRVYSAMLPFDIPSEFNASMIRLDTAAPHLSYVTENNDVVGMTKFYVRHLQATGWKLEQNQKTARETLSHRVFSGSHYQPVLLEIQSKGDQETWVELRPVDKAEIAAILLKAKREADPDTASPTNDIASSELKVTESQNSATDALNAAEQEMASQIRKAFDLAAQDLENAGADNAQAKALLQELKAQANAISAAAGTGNPEKLVDSLFNHSNHSDTDTTNDVSAEESEKPIDETHGVIAEKFPLPTTAKEVKRQADIESISYYTHKIRPEAEFFAKELKKLGFRPRGESQIDDDFGVMQFQKGNGSVRISFIKDDRNKIPVRVMILGDALLWPGHEDPYGIETGEFIAEGDQEFPDDDAEFSGGEDFTPTEHDGIHLPKNMSSVATSGTPFLTLIEGTKKAKLETLVAFFQDGMKKENWQRDEQRTSVSASKAKLVFRQNESIATFELEQFGKEVDIKITKRNIKEAKAAGILPSSGKARIVLANAAQHKAIITINKKSYEVAAGVGAENPAEGKKIDLPPGTYQYSVQVGSETQKDKIKIDKGGAWGIIAFPGGQFSDRVF